MRGKHLYSNRFVITTTYGITYCRLMLFEKKRRQVIYKDSFQRSQGEANLHPHIPDIPNIAA